MGASPTEMSSVYD